MTDQNQKSIKWDNLVSKRVHLWNIQEEEEEEKPEKQKSPWDSAHLTISRAYSTGGYKIGTVIAERLNWDVYSRNLVEYIASTTNVRKKIVQTMDENVFSQGWVQALFNSNYISKDRYYRHLVEVILTLANHGKAVIVGRGANFITDNTNGLHVRLTAPYKYRVNRYAKKFNASERDAKKKVDQVDSARGNYIKKYFNSDINDPNAYDVVINVEKYTNDKIIEIILKALEQRLGEEIPEPSQKETAPPT